MVRDGEGVAAGGGVVDRRGFLATGAAVVAGVAGVALGATPARAMARGGGSVQVPVEELSATEAAARMSRGELTARDLTAAYLGRIAAIDRDGPALRSVIEVNPDALAIAEERDRERAAGRVRGALHGVPILLKDNIDTGDRMATSAGSMALAAGSAPRDAFLVKRLREAGAVLLGKTNLSEWANFRSTRSTSGWSARGGQVRNPYVLDRNACGSSSGTGAAIAASLAAIGVGTETDGSIICPSSHCGLVGIKPTVGLVSRDGIVPISVTQDTAGPMARTVADAALLLGAMTGEDASDPVTLGGGARAATDYTRTLDVAALRGARIGVARNLAGFHPAADAAFAEALRALREAGAVLVDPADVPTAGQYDDAEFDVLLYEFKDGIARYLASRGAGTPLRTLADLIAFNRANATRELAWFGQEIFERAEAKGPLTDAAYQQALARCRRLSRDEGLDAVFATHRVEAIVAPSNGPAWPIDPVNGDRYTGGNSTVAAVAGYPSVTVPMGYAHELPLGLSFIGAPWSEARLVGFAHAFEQATRVRRAPRYRPTVGAS
jgi:amidase